MCRAWSNGEGIEWWGRDEPENFFSVHALTNIENIHFFRNLLAIHYSYQLLYFWKIVALFQRPYFKGLV